MSQTLDGDCSFKEGLGLAGECNRSFVAKASFSLFLKRGNHKDV